MGLRADINDLIARYAWAADEDDIDGIAACFTADGVFATNNGSPPAEGVDAIRELFASARRRRAAAGQRTRHVMGNVLVAKCADGATAKSYLTLVTTQPDGRTAVECSAEYNDTLVQVGGKWRFSERRITFDVLPSSLVPD